jgi:hypothetical protein
VSRVEASLNSDDVIIEFVELPDYTRCEVERNVRAGYLAGMPDGARCIPKVTRVARGIVPD